MKIKIDKDIYVRDQYGVRRRTFVAGEEVEGYVYRAVLKHNTVLNPEDLPVIAVEDVAIGSFHSKPMETKELPIEEPVAEPEVEQVEPVVEEPEVKKRKGGRPKKHVDEEPAE